MAVNYHSKMYYNIGPGSHLSLINGIKQDLQEHLVLVNRIYQGPGKTTYIVSARFRYRNDYIWQAILT